MKIEVRSSPFAELPQKDRNEFWRIHEAFYGETAKGFTDKHRRRYAELEKGHSPHAYIATLDGNPIACALVLGKNKRWYSLAVDERQVLSFPLERDERKKLIRDVIKRIGTRIIREHPGAWGTVDASKPGRIDFFTSGRWRAADKHDEVFERFPETPKSEIGFGRTQAGHLTASRKNSTNAPYEQVVLLLKATKRRAAGKK